MFVTLERSLQPATCILQPATSGYFLHTSSGRKMRRARESSPPPLMEIRSFLLQSRVAEELCISSRCIPHTCLATPRLI